MSKLKPATKTAMYAALAESSGLSKKQVSTLFDELASMIKKDLGKKGPGVVTLPGLLKIKRIAAAVDKSVPETIFRAQSLLKSLSQERQPSNPGSVLGHSRS